MRLKCGMCEKGIIDIFGHCDNCMASDETYRSAILALSSRLVEEGLFENGWDAQHDILLNREKYAKQLYTMEAKILRQ